MPSAYENYLTTRATLQRIARTLGIDPEQETHVLAGEIEEGFRKLARSIGVVLATSELTIKPCCMCGDTEGGPWLIVGNKMFCESCWEALPVATREDFENHGKVPS
jgi:hypothetical protein